MERLYLLCCLLGSKTGVGINASFFPGWIFRMLFMLCVLKTGHVTSPGPSQILLLVRVTGRPGSHCAGGGGVRVGGAIRVDQLPADHRVTAAAAAVVANPTGPARPGHVPVIHGHKFDQDVALPGPGPPSCPGSESWPDVLVGPTSTVTSAVGFAVSLSASRLTVWLHQTGPQ